MTPGRCPNQPSPRWQRILLTAFREPGRHFFCQLYLHPQLGDRRFVIPGLGPQPLGPLGLAQRGIRVLPGLRGSSCHLHPLAKSHLVDADVAGDLSDRTATVNDESYRLLLVLRRKCAACRTHFSLSRRIGQLCIPRCVSASSTTLTAASGPTSGERPATLQPARQSSGSPTQPAPRTS